MQTAEFRGFLFPISDAGLAAEQKAIAELEKCMKREKKRFSRLKTAPTPTAFKQRAHDFLASPACRFAALFRQASALHEANRLPLTIYQSLIPAFSPMHPIIEDVVYWDEPKSNGGTRRIHDFGPMNRAAQHMVMRVISACFKPKPYQYSVAGRGVHTAIQRARAAVDAGYVHIKKLDVRDFFGSFSRDGLYELLPLPKAVIDNVVMPDNQKLKHVKGDKKAGKAKTATTGKVLTTDISPLPSQPVLPQGSLHAPMLAEFVVSNLSIDGKSDVVIIIFVDDILIMAKTEHALAAATYALRSAYGASPAGDFHFKVSEETLFTGTDFLGYRLKHWPGGKLSAHPSADNIAVFKAKHKQHTTSITKIAKHSSANLTSLKKAIADYYIFMRSWIAAFSAANGYDEMAVEAQSRLVKMCRKHDVSVASVKQLANAHFAHSTTKVKTKGGYQLSVTINEPDPLLSATGAKKSA